MTLPSFLTWALGVKSHPPITQLDIEREALSAPVEADIVSDDTILVLTLYGWWAHTKDGDFVSPKGVGHVEVFVSASSFTNAKGVYINHTLTDWVLREVVDKDKFIITSPLGVTYLAQLGESDTAWTRFITKSVTPARELKNEVPFHKAQRGYNL